MNAYEQSLKIQRDNYSVRQAAVKEGLAEGEHKKALEIASEMKRENLPLDLIMKLTELSKDEIESL